MAIQIRRGASEDFDASKMVAGELGVATDGSHKMWATGQAGDSWELANKEDLDEEVGARETLAETVEAQGESLEGKAEVDGMYDDLYAGGLTTDKAQEDKIPYLFRKTGGTLSRVGERCYDTIVGASVGENQLVQNGDFSDGTNGWNIQNATASVSENVLTVTPSGTTNSSVVAQPKSIEAHVYLGVATIKNNAPSGATSLQFRDGNAVRTLATTSTVGTWVNIVGMYKATSANTAGYIRVLFPQVSNIDGVTFMVKNINVIDLTAKFGSSIADYIYSLESATAGAGISKLREWGFLRGYQAYNAGSIESVEVTGKKVVGFNQWDEVWEPGGINENTGENDTGGNRIRSKNYIPVIPSATYYYKTQTGFYMYMRYYDADKNYLGASSSYVSNSQDTIANNVHYIRFMMYKSGWTDYANHGDICINLSSDRNGEYEPYTEQTYDYGTDTLNGIFKLDANNNLYADGDRKTSDGLITRKYALIDLGTLNYTYYEGSNYTMFITDGITIANKERWGGICDIYPLVALAMGTLPDKAISTQYSDGRLRIKDSSYTDAASFKQAMSGKYLVYEKQTPTTEQGDPFPSPQVCYPDGTEEFITESGVPVGHETEYPYDLKGLVEELIDVPDVPSANGTYVLKATRSASGITYTWVADSAVSLASPLMSASPQTTTDESDESEEEGETR